MENNNHDYKYDDYKKFSELYHNIYIDCIKFKNKKQLSSNKEIDCDIYLNTFIFFSEKYNNDKEQNS